jgi:hypothetical protein
MHPDHSRRSTPALLVLPFVALMACGGDEPVAPPPACRESVTLSVVAGPTPTIDWTPKCTVYGLMVIQPQAQMTLRWEITSEVGIAPGLRYGQAPRGATVGAAPEVLLAGEDAIVQVYLKGPRGISNASSVVFTP